LLSVENVLRLVHNDGADRPILVAEVVVELRVADPDALPNILGAGAGDPRSNIDAAVDTDQ
jgi:hypothetical protein